MKLDAKEANRDHHDINQRMTSTTLSGHSSKCSQSDRSIKENNEECCIRMDTFLELLSCPKFCVQHFLTVFQISFRHHFETKLKKLHALQERSSIHVLFKRSI